MNIKITSRCLLGLVVGGCLVIAVALPEVKGADESASRIGVFDSRAVACAWVTGKGFEKQLQEMKDQHGNAKAAGDEKRVKELETLGPELQELVHGQFFGNEPIDNILEMAILKDQLPNIAKEAGVGMLVSKWEIAYQDDSVKTVDVTWEMVNLFDPSAQTVKTIKDVMKSEPIKDFHH